MVHLISYDLKGHERPRAYAAVKRFVESNAISSRRPLYSQWLVETSSTPNEWVDALRSANVIDADDQLFVCQVRRPYQGWLDKEIWDWLRPRI